MGYYEEVGSWSVRLCCLCERSVGSAVRPSLFFSEFSTIYFAQVGALRGPRASRGPAEEGSELCESSVRIFFAN